MMIESIKGNKYYYDNKNGQIYCYKDQGDLTDSKKKYRIYSEEIEHYQVIDQSDLYRYLYTDGNGFKQLILEVTSLCNLRCRYCIYSECYPNTRTHGEKVMEFDVAQKAIDYYMTEYKKVLQRNPMKKLIISFYGGEPLAAFQRLKEIVLYINDAYGKYDINYNITTNGLLLNEEQQDFLMDNHFMTLVSLDSYKENHDRNRVDINGKETFERVYENLMAYYKKYGNRNISISCCFDYKTDFFKLAEFFENLPFDVTSLTQVQSSNTTYYKQFSDEDSNNLMEAYGQLKAAFFDQIQNRTIDKNSFLYKYFSALFASFAYHPMMLENQPPIKPFTGTCIPGEKLYIDVNGNFKICEKINSSYNIGNIDSGLNYDTICEILNSYNTALFEKCKVCPISRLCKMCFKDFDGKDGFNIAPEICQKQINTVRGTLYDYISLLEMNPVLFDEITSDYYTNISEKGEFI